MKNILKYTSAVLFAASLMTACTGNFESLNTNPKGVTDEDLKQDNNFVGMHFPQMFQSIYFNKGNGAWEYQLIQNLNADIYSGYMASGSSFAYGNNNMHYALNHGWNDYCWNYAYQHVMGPWLKIHNKCLKDMDTYKHFDAIATVCKVLTMSRLCDQYGPIIYSKYGETKTGGTYDSAQDAYKQFFADLTEASKILGEASKSDVASFASFDFVYGGDFAKWAQMANSLRLRLAMRIVKADKEEAKKQAEAAISDQYGLILNNKENFAISNSTYKNPLATLTGTRAWHDILLNANVSSILTGYGDARLEKMALPNDAGNIAGLRNGVTNLDKHTEYKDKNTASALNVTDETPVVMFNAAETDFLLAEAALRGWNVPGTAQQYYEAGIKASFEQWGADLGNYLENTNKPADFVDASNPEYNCPAVETATPKWDESLSPAEKLRKIAVQKWIAIFPEGMNGWAEYRRTGYPKQFEIMRNDSQGEIDTKLGVRRLSYTTTERDNNPEGYAGALKALNGPDTGATRIFWDVDADNI